jgi:hypothetical protein
MNNNFLLAIYIIYFKINIDPIIPKECPKIALTYDINDENPDYSLV